MTDPDTPQARGSAAHEPAAGRLDRPPQVRQLREMVRHRAKLVAWRSGLKASVHGVLAKQGLHPPVTDLSGVGGRQWLNTAPLDAAYRLRVNALLRLIDAIDFESTAVADAQAPRVRHRRAARTDH